MWVAELVTISGLADLHLAIRKAEEIEMARSLASGGQQGQKTQNPFRGKGRFQRGRGRFNAVQTNQLIPNGQQDSSMMQTQQLVVNVVGKANAQCYNYSGYGHYY